MCLEEVMFLVSFGSGNRSRTGCFRVMSPMWKPFHSPAKSRSYANICALSRMSRKLDDPGVDLCVAISAKTHAFAEFFLQFFYSISSAYCIPDVEVFSF